MLVTFKREPGRLRLTVADDGKGLDPQRADSGLGGRLVEGFAQQLGGQLERESSSRGTTVRLLLPSPEGVGRRFIEGDRARSQAAMFTAA